MSWAVVPGLAIIAGAFSAAGGLLYGIQHLAYGKQRKIRQDEFDFDLGKRDQRISDLFAAQQVNK
eukprot:CAMPEP_0194578726 /NCGR_PEP_ID=MMETSP0292-20121207/13042_1 /TAXON_ID=39354 /ORGANISM="Heterosigma akashiwo, Strain CCMP2393" /LENGTH=64 /DNA_ID=CAMNT_0039431465 /DNA_START=59 /DNA_END=253 /DNA_ORIENTATION=-